ncbi:MAG: hypothetical protein IKW54_04425, partial [Bacteroidales bacterium]|nr:hypothetical protein [Bacteroidales bacterium]
GVEYTFAGLGFEAYPYKGNKNLRLHGLFAFNEMGNCLNSNQDSNTASELTCQVQVGVTWRIDFAKQFK